MLIEGSNSLGVDIEVVEVGVIIKDLEVDSKEEVDLVILIEVTYKKEIEMLRKEMMRGKTLEEVLEVEVIIHTLIGSLVNLEEIEEVHHIEVSQTLGEILEVVSRVKEELALILIKEYLIKVQGEQDALMKYQRVIVVMVMINSFKGVVDIGVLSEQEEVTLIGEEEVSLIGEEAILIEEVLIEVEVNSAEVAIEEEALIKVLHFNKKEEDNSQKSVLRKNNLPEMMLILIIFTMKDHREPEVEEVDLNFDSFISINFF